MSPVRAVEAVEMSGLDLVEAQAKSEPASKLEIPLGDTTVMIKPIKAWPVSNVRSIKEGDFDDWARKCLYPGSFETWQEIDPTYEQVEEFFAAVNKATGQHPGK